MDDDFDVIFADISSTVPYSQYMEAAALVRSIICFVDEWVCPPQLLEQAYKIAQIANVYDLTQRINNNLSGSYTAEGIRQWWKRQRPQLDGLTPKEAISQDKYYQTLLNLSKIAESV